MILKLLDCATTIYLVNHGLTEMNPLAFYVNDNPYLTLISLPVMLIMSCGLRLYQEKRRQHKIIIHMLDAAYLMVILLNAGLVINNFIVVMML